MGRTSIGIIEFLRKCKRRQEVIRFDNYRNCYDNLSFVQKKQLAQKWLKKYPEQSHFTYEPIQYCIEQFVISPPKILELGGWRGDLAMRALSEFNKIEIWHNYDLLDNESLQKCMDKRYKMISLDDYIWKKSLDFDYNAIIATHMIEHIKWDELMRLIQWIPSQIKTVLFEAPLPESSEYISWKGDHSSHVLEKGWQQIIAAMKMRRYNIVYKNFDTYIFFN